MPDGQLAIAPWRQTSRENFINGLAARDWRDMQMEHMPFRFFSEDDADEDTDPPLLKPILVYLPIRLPPLMGVTI